MNWIRMFSVYADDVFVIAVNINNRKVMYCIINHRFGKIQMDIIFAVLKKMETLKRKWLSWNVLVDKSKIIHKNKSWQKSFSWTRVTSMGFVCVVFVFVKKKKKTKWNVQYKCCVFFFCIYVRLRLRFYQRDEMRSVRSPLLPERAYILHWKHTHTHTLHAILFHKSI